jgi:putative FmdB family regulatory protein
MPTYEYRCPAGHEFERFYRKISDAAPGVTCPECGKIAARIMSIGGGFAFKGSGFYLTDYGKNAHRGSAPQADGGGGDSASASGEGSSAKETSSSETSSASKEGLSPAKETSGSKDSGSSAKSGAGAESKPAPASKPAESNSSSESKPKKSGGSKSSKDK